MITNESDRVSRNNGYRPARWRIRRPVYYEGVQWAVTGYGLENTRGPIRYDLSWKELLSQGFQFWLEHLSDKTWVSVTDLTKAMKQAKRRAPASGECQGSHIER